MKDDTLIYNDLIEAATELARTMISYKKNSDTVYSTFKIMIEKVRKEDIFKVNYINLIDFTTHDGSRVVK